METPVKENFPLDSHFISNKLRARMQRSGKSRLALEKTLPLLLNHLSQVIGTGDPEESPRVWIDIHGSSLEDIVTEYDALKDIILDSLSHISSEERNKVIETILYFMGITAWEYSKQNNLHHEKLERDLKEKIQQEQQERIHFERALEERTRNEEKHKAMMEDLKEEKSLREAFVSSLTHDLRTPLAVARMHTEMIARKVDPQLINKCRKVIMHIDEVDRMIQDLLDTNKLKAGEKIPVYPSNICLSDCVNEAVSDFVDLHGDRFILELQDNVCGFWCEKAMRRIIDNLLGNAIKHGDPTRAITINLSQVDGETILKVHNFGPCISKADQAKLFQPFKRSAKSHKKTGWGIGLSLVKGLVDAQDGKIALESSDESGTSFRLSFPNHVRDTLH